MNSDATPLRTRLPPAMYGLLSPVVLESLPTNTVNAVPVQYAPSAFYQTKGMRCVPPPRSVSRLLFPAEIRELAGSSEEPA
jgi:hypothetical protein